MNQFFKQKICNPTTKVVGAGSVFGFGICEKVGKNPFFIEDLEEVVLNLPGKNDEALGGDDFASVEGSNSILVLGYMQGLNINQLSLAKVNNADGALIHQPFWE